MAIWNRIPKKTIFFIIFLVIVYALAGFFAVPVLTEKYLPDQAAKALGRQVTIRDAAFNPFLLSASIDGLDIRNKEGENSFFSADRIYVRAGLSSLFRLAWVIPEIRVEKPFVNIVREKDGTFNFDMPGGMKTPDAKGMTAQDPDRDIPAFILENVRISGGEVRFEDKPVAVNHRMTGLSIFLPYLSSQPDKRYAKAGMDIQFVLNQSRADIHLETTPFAEDRATRAIIKTRDINVPYYLAYLPVPAGLKVKTLGVNTDVDAFFRVKQEKIALEIQGRVNALNLDLTDTLDTPVVRFERLSVDILKSDVMSGRLNLGNVLLVSPDVNIIRDEQGQLNLMSYSMETKTGSPEPGVQTGENTAKQQARSVDKNNPAFQLKLAAFDINNASVALKDLSHAAPFETRISPMTVRFENVSLGESVNGTYFINLETNNKEKLDSAGRFSVNPLSAEGKLTVSDVSLKKYAPYYHSFTDLDIEDGKVSMDTEFDIRQARDRINGSARVSEMLIDSLAILDRQSGEKMVHLPRIKVTGSSVDFGQQKVNTGTVKIEPGQVFLKRLKNGQFNLVSAFQTGPGSIHRKQGAMTKQQSDSSESQGETTPGSWDVALPIFDLAGLDLHFQDLTNQEPVNIDLSDMVIKASNLQTSGNEKGDLSVQMRWNKQGKITLAGKVLPGKRIGAFDVNLDKIDIKSVQPYFTEAVKVVVTDGDIRTRGKLSMDISNPSEPVIRFVGQSFVSQFVALDKKNARDFFKAKSFYVSGLDVSVFPISVMIKDISLTDFYSRIMINPAGEMNLNSIFTKASAQDGARKNRTAQMDVENKEPAPASSQIKIENVTLQGGEIQFSDYFTQPNFTAGMKEVAGSVTGLSSEKSVRAKLNLKGVHGTSSPLDIIGTINPLARTKFADIHISFKDIELSSFTPYAAKYLGYKIEKGKLILDLEYMINGNQLKSENRARFDNFALGESVDSKDATSLPVSLAISLLKNKQGQINLDLPVTGRLDDPEFSFSGIVFKMIGNLILKVATSPFSIIGAMFDGGEDLEYLDFKNGEITINPENMGKIDKLVQILVAKPSVKLEIQSIYDYDSDARNLRMKGFQDLIKAEKIKQMLAKGSTATTLKDVTISEEEMPIYVYLAYTKAKFPKPRNAAGGEKQVDVEEKKKLLMTNIAVNKDDLRLLSLRRAQTVKAYILSTSKVNKERIFILEPIEKPKDEKEKISRVKFLLK